MNKYPLGCGKLTKTAKEGDIHDKHICRFRRLCQVS